MSASRLLAPDEPPPVVARNETSDAPLFLACDHAGRLMPRALGTLGLPESELDRHIAWDIGARGVARALADDRLALVEQSYSRLVIDCNRSVHVASAIPEISESTPIPGNVGLDGAARARREAEIHRPYHERIRALLDARAAQCVPTVLVAVHSFTPVFGGVARPWHVGVLFNRDDRIGRVLARLLEDEGDLMVGINEPYRVSDENDYTIPVHGERRGLPHVEIEIRQDLIAGAAGQIAWADRLARLLPRAVAASGVLA